jgi:hypothetical protein
MQLGTRRYITGPVLPFRGKIGLMASPRWLAPLLAGVAILAGAGLALRPARVTWLNSGLRIDYPWPRAAAALGAALGAALLATLLRRRLLRLLALTLAFLFLLFGARLLAYRVDAGDRGLTLRGLLGSTTLLWAEVARVETGERALVLTDRAEARLAVGTGDLAPDQRAGLERTIARRVRESGPAARP